MTTTGSNGGEKFWEVKLKQLGLNYNYYWMPIIWNRYCRLLFSPVLADRALVSAVDCFHFIYTLVLRL